MRSTVPFTGGVMLLGLLTCWSGGRVAHGAASSSASVQAQPAGTSTPLASSEGSLEGVRVEVTELKRASGGTLSLRFRIVNDSDRTLNVSDFMIGTGGLIGGGSNYTIDGVHVIDLTGKKKYFVATDSAGACVCSQFAAIKSKSRASHWARFSAPPETVERLTVVIPPFAPMDDVPVSR